MWLKNWREDFKRVKIVGKGEYRYVSYRVLYICCK